MKAIGCENDEARSMRICYAPAGIRIRIYDNGDLDGKNDDWAEITVLRDMCAGKECSTCVTIGKFEFEKTTYLNGNNGGNILVKVVYKSVNGLDGKVSSFEVRDITGKNTV